MQIRGDKKIKEKNKLKNIFNILGDVFKPILPAITGAGMLQGLLALSQATGIGFEETSTFTILTSTSQAVFYFLPILVGLSAAKIFSVNPYISLSVLLLLFYPDFIFYLQSELSPNFLGLDIFEIDYSSSVFPAIFIVWSQKYVENFSRKVTPPLIEGVVAPIINLGVTAGLALIIFGPLGYGISFLLSLIIQFVGSFAPWLVPALLGGLGIFAVMTGAHYPLFPLMLDQLASQGFEDFFSAGMIAMNISLAGATLGIILKNSDPKLRQYGISAFITALLGTSQPAIYGIALKYRSVLMGSILGGFAGGLFAGITRFVAYGYVNPGLAALPVYIPPDGNLTNLIKGLIAMLIAFFIAFIYVYFFEPKSEKASTLI